MQEIIILAVLPAFFVSREPTNKLKTSQNSVRTDPYILIERSDDFTTASGFEV